MSETTTKKPRLDNALDVYKDEVLAAFKADIKQIVAATSPSSREELRLQFNRHKGCDISPSVFADLLDDTGIKLERAVTIAVPD